MLMMRKKCGERDRQHSAVDTARRGKWSVTPRKSMLMRSIHRKSTGQPEITINKGQSRFTDSASRVSALI